jgi:hypothetical protein
MKFPKYIQTTKNELFPACGGNKIYRGKIHEFQDTRKAISNMYRYRNFRDNPYDTINIHFSRFGNNKYNDEKNI